MKSFDQFLVEANPDYESFLTEDDLKTDTTGDTANTWANIFVMVCKVSKRYSDAQLRAYHDWFIPQLESKSLEA